jgi:hypothetical protein
LEEVAMKCREELIDGDQKISRGLTEALIGETTKIRGKYDEAIKITNQTYADEIRNLKQDIEDMNTIKNKEIEGILEKLRADQDESIKLVKI